MTLLQGLELLGQGRLGDVQAARGATDAALAGNGVERPQVLVIDGHCHPVGDGLGN